MAALENPDSSNNAEREQTPGENPEVSIPIPWDILENVLGVDLLEKLRLKEIQKNVNQSHDVTVWIRAMTEMQRAIGLVKDYLRDMRYSAMTIPPGTDLLELSIIAMESPLRPQWGKRVHSSIVSPEEQQTLMTSRQGHRPLRALTLEQNRILDAHSFDGYVTYGRSCGVCEPAIGPELRYQAIYNICPNHDQYRYLVGDLCTDDRIVQFPHRFYQTLSSIGQTEWAQSRAIQQFVALVISQNLLLSLGHPPQDKFDSLLAEVRPNVDEPPDTWTVVPGPHVRGAEKIWTHNYGIPKAWMTDFPPTAKIGTGVIFESDTYPAEYFGGNSLTWYLFSQAIQSGQTIKDIWLQRQIHEGMHGYLDGVWDLLMGGLPVDNPGHEALVQYVSNDPRLKTPTAITFDDVLNNPYPKASPHVDMPLPLYRDRMAYFAMGKFLLAVEEAMRSHRHIGTTIRGNRRAPGLYVAQGEPNIPHGPAWVNYGDKIDGLGQDLSERALVLTHLFNAAMDQALLNDFATLTPNDRISQTLTRMLHGLCLDLDIVAQIYNQLNQPN